MVQVDADEAQQQPARVYAEDFPEAVVDGVANFIGKPRLRGWIHVYAAVVALIAGAALVSVSWSLRIDPCRHSHPDLHADDRRDVRGQRCVSPGELEVGDGAQVDEAPRPLDDLHLHRRQLHTVRAAGAAVRRTAWCCSAIVWAGAIAGVLLKMFWPSAPRWVGVPLYLLLGWVAAWFVAPIMHGAGVAALVLLIVGGALYSIGGVLYGLKWPNPWPHDVRPSRVLPRVHGGGRDLPLHRDVVRRLLAICASVRVCGRHAGVLPQFSHARGDRGEHATSARDHGDHKRVPRQW